jgi:hypothetical protein
MRKVSGAEILMSHMSGENGANLKQSVANSNLYRALRCSSARQLAGDCGSVAVIEIVPGFTQVLSVKYNVAQDFEYCCRNFEYCSISLGTQVISGCISGLDAYFQYCILNLHLHSGLMPRSARASHVSICLCC